MSKVCRWCFTVNNPGAWRPVWNAEHMDYMCYEIEHGESGTEHVQGYVRFKARKALNTAKGLICQEAHMEKAKGNEGQNRTYCNKENGIVEHGTFDEHQGARQGQRTDLSTAIDKLRSGTSKAQVFMEHPELLVKYPAGMEKAAEMLMGEPPTARDVHNTVLWGATGTGKTHRCMMENPNAYCTVVGPKGTFDLYSGQSVVILDEFDPNQVDIHILKTWLDKWKVQLQCRYANHWARWTAIYITTQTNPSTWYQGNTLEDRQALMRRLADPMGRIYQVLARDQEVNLKWWDATREPARPLDTPAAAGTSAQPAALIRKRTTPPSRTSSPSSEPPLSRQRLSGSPQGSLIEPIEISDSEESQKD